MNITKKKQTHRYREKITGYQWGEGRGEGQDRGREVGGTNYKVTNNKQQGSIAQHGEYSQYFTITINEVLPLKFVNHCFAYL